MQFCDYFINYIGKNYDKVEKKVKMLCGRNKQSYSKDSFQDAILKCYNAIQKKGTLKDTSAYGMESYLIKSYFNRVIDEKRNCHQKLRDANIDSDSINNLYEEWFNSNNDSSRLKVASDLWKDFSTLYIMSRVEENFDAESTYLFKLKFLCGYTYKQVCSKVKCTGCRVKILDVKNWLITNVTKDDIRKSFQAMYGEIL